MTDEIQHSKNEFAGGRPDTPSHGPGAPVPRRRIPAWVLVILGGFLFCLLFGVIVGIATLVLPASRPAARGLQERMMPDGTILVLEKVTVGAVHQFEWQRKQSFTDWISGNWTQKHTANASAQGEAIIVWFSRRDPATDACLDVDWWLRSAAVDDRGDEIGDDNAGRNSFTASGSSGLSGSRPFSPNPPGAYQMIVAHSTIRPFRHSGNSFKLRLYDSKGDVVGEFDVPHTISATLPVWKSEPLPATRKADDLDVTLAGLALESHAYTEGVRKRTMYNVKPELLISREGKVEGEVGVREFEFEDVFGNTGNQWDCRLDFHEPAWKLKIKLWSAEQLSSRPGSEWSVSGVSLPEATKVNLIRQNKVVDGVTVEFVATGGTGTVVYTDAAPTGSGNGSSSAGGNFGDSAFNVETRTGGGVATTTINCKLPHLLLRVTGADPDHRLVVRVRDDQGRTVPVQQSLVADQTIVFLQSATDVKTLHVTFVVQEPKKVEFFVEPPRVTAPREPAEPRKK